MSVMLLPSDVATPSTNPFTPDFGQAPQALVGRDAVISDLLSGLATGPTDARFTTILLGPRGSGKTVVQAEIEHRVEAAGWLVLSVDSNTPGLPDRVNQAIARARDTYEGADEADLDKGKRTRWAGLTLGPVGWHREVFDAVRPDWDMRHQLAALSEHAARSDTAVLLTVDELQGGDAVELRRLAGDLQKIVKKESLPLAFLGAGLSQLKHTLLTNKDVDVLPSVYSYRDAAAERRRRHSRAQTDHPRCRRQHRPRRAGIGRRGSRKPPVQAPSGRPQRLEHRWRP